MRTKLLAYITLLAACQATAQETFIAKYGLGVSNSAKSSNSETIFGSVAYQKPFAGLWIQQYELGGWGDRRTDMGRKNSAFGSYSLGLNLDMNYMYAQALWGVAGLTQTDSYLGGHFQFNHDFAFGFQDKRGVSIGVAYKHLSSAGIFKPNIGRDFLAIRIGLPL